MFLVPEMDGYSKIVGNSFQDVIQGRFPSARYWNLNLEKLRENAHGRSKS
jgi:hypothetical protein